ncbi:hypothetical protein [Mesorhizobium sp. SARCC-RB16n]|uniref:hypothetical protein n=1 Tax=Mesorhizobium sp. SARCC-RB16n TaxID=2116687 RepID=UPI00122F0D94|nr:hypothetical protein [Mesorhizobium sp. SARCC-RB16n]
MIYGKGRLDAKHAAETALLKGNLKVAELNLKNEKDARLGDAILATEAAKRQAALSTKIDELNTYAETLEDANRECLSGADVERLRDLWK